MNHASILKQLRGERLFLAEHEGAMWATNSYWLVKVADEKHPIATLLADYNLPLEPMFCLVGRTIRRDPNGKVPDVGALIAKHARATEPLTRHTLNGLPVTVDAGGAKTVEVWNAGERFVSLNPYYRHLVEALGRCDGWRAGSDRTSPVIAVREKATVGLLMPVRTLLDEIPVSKTTKRKAAA